MVEPSNIDKRIFLNTSNIIGKQLCTQAHWSGRKCNWIGRYIESPKEINGLPTSVNRNLGPELYDGTSGIALFLCYLYELTKDENYRITAEAAMTLALSRCKYIPAIYRFALYSGHVGVAYAAIKLGLILKNQALIEQGTDTMREISKDTKATHLMDVISGNAGAIPVLIEMYEFLHEEPLLDLAVILGRELLLSRTEESIGWSWGSKANGIESVQRNLTGFAHGAAGIGYGLLELFQATGDIVFRDGAENAFAYENSLFDIRNANWPDFRTTNVASSKPNNPGYMVAWCHGAPGIGLSRLRAFRILGKEIYGRDYKLAIQTSIKAIKDENSGVRYVNYSLCHGLTGICELLMVACSELNDDLYESVIFDVAHAGIQRYSAPNLPWPCGIQSGETPGLMLGLAGIGYFYLRLYDPKVPSMQIITSLTTKTEGG